MLATGQVLKLQPQVKIYWIVRLFLFLFIISLPFFIGGFKTWFLIFLVFIVLGVFAAIYSSRDYEKFAFKIDEDKLTINPDGPAKPGKVLPFVNVHEVTVVDGILRHAFGLATLSVWNVPPPSPATTPPTAKTKMEKILQDPAGRLWLTSADALWLKSYIEARRF